MSFIYGRAAMFVRRDDGSLQYVGEVIEVTTRLVTGEAMPGSCPECSRVPLDGQPIICEHGVTIR